MGIRGRARWVSRAITVTEQAIARSVDCECPISDATSDSLRSSSVRAIALILANSLPNRGVAVALGSELASMSAIARTEDERAKRVRGRVGDRAFTVNRTGDSPFCDCECP